MRNCSGVAQSTKFIDPVLILGGFDAVAEQCISLSQIPDSLLLCFLVKGMHRCCKK